MYQPDFTGCRAKLYRAIEHRNALQRYISKHITAKDNRPTVGIKFKPETGEHAVYISRCPDFRPHLERCSILLSDAVQNFRVSLDYLAFQLALRNKSGVLDNPMRVQFPIEDDPTAFTRRLKATSAKDTKGWLAELSSRDQKILERYQPYHAEKGDTIAENQERICGSHCGFLYALREISNPDKHRLPTIVLLPPVKFVDARPALSMITSGHLRRQKITGERSVPITVEAGTEIFWCKMPGWPETNVEVAAHLTLLVSIQIGKIVKLIPTLDQITRIIHLLLAEFDPVLRMKRLVNEP